MKHWTNDVIKSSEALKKLIAENPDLPIVVLAGEEANGGDYSWYYCSSVQFEITELLTVETPYDDGEYAITDREELEERIDDWALDDGRMEKDAERKAFVERELQKYDPYWKKVIAIYANN